MYMEMFWENDGTKIRPAIIKRDEDENNIKTIYLIRNVFDYKRYETESIKKGNPNEALEFHVTCDKKTGKLYGVLFYDTYKMDYTRKTGVRVKISYRNSITWFTKVHEGYKYTDLRRYLINFFPPEINSINALQIFLDKMFHGNLKNLRLR